MTAQLATARSLLPGEGRGAREAAFPFGLARQGVHEIVPGAYGDLAAATGFALAAGAASAPGVGVWVRGAARGLDQGLAAGAGLLGFGADPSRWLFVEARKPMEALWAVEEAVAASACALVVGEVEAADFTATRRLALASQRAGTPVVLLCAHGREGATAAAARWRVSARASAANRWDARSLGRARWRAGLARCRAAPGAVGRMFDLEWDDETLSLRVVDGLAARPPAPRAAGGAGRLAGAFARKAG